MIISINKVDNLIYKKKYNVGDFGFIHRTRNKDDSIFDQFMTGMIGLFGCDPYSMFRANHMFMVYDKEHVLEADGHDSGRVCLRPLAHYEESNDLIIIKSLRKSLRDKIVYNGKLRFRKEDLKLGTKFSEWAIFYLAFEKIPYVEKALKNFPAPKLGTSGIMCSNYFGMLLNNEPEFKNLFPFNYKHPSKVTPEDFLISTDLFDNDLLSETVYNKYSSKNSGPEEDLGM